MIEYNKFITLLSQWVQCSMLNLQNALDRINKYSQEIKPEFLDNVESVSKSFIETFGASVEFVKNGPLGDLLQNRIFNGTLSIIGSALTLAGIVAAGIPSGGLSWLLAGAQAAFAVNSMVEGISNVVGGLNGEEGEGFNPLHEITGHKMDGAIDALDFALGFASYKTPKQIRMEKALNMAKNDAELQKFMKNPFMKGNKQVLNMEEAVKFRGGLQKRDDIIQMLINDHEPLMIKQGKKIVMHQKADEYRKLIAKEKFDKASEYYGRFETANTILSELLGKDEDEE